jgi:hypothetical protein
MIVAVGNGADRSGLRIIKLGLAGSAVALVLTLMGSGGARAENPGTPEQQAACTPDAMRLCSAEIPNVPAIIACMKRKRAQVSVECRTAMAKGPHPHVAERSHHAEKKRAEHRHHHVEKVAHRSQERHERREARY